jgi:transposase
VVIVNMTIMKFGRHLHLRHLNGFVGVLILRKALIMSRRYPRQVRDWVVSLVLEYRDCYESEHAAIRSISTNCGIGADSLRKWVRQVEIDAGVRSGTSSQEPTEIRRLRQENAELKRANEILMTASARFAADSTVRRRAPNVAAVRGCEATEPVRTRTCRDRDCVSHSAAQPHRDYADAERDQPLQQAHQTPRTA